MHKNHNQVQGLVVKIGGEVVLEEGESEEGNLTMYA